MTGNEIIVDVENIWKKFCRDLRTGLWYGVRDLATEFAGRRRRDVLRRDEFWAVNDVSFQLKRGECLGLIGRNGAGKSTVLKMLSGLIKPDRGKITCRGRVGALIELGAGFNPILSGRENIYVNGSVLGMSKKEVDRKLESIVEFAEISEFIDAPVQSYSSGMRVRLGFAVASQMEPDILLIDEVLAVGDTGFRYKCLNRIKDLLSGAAVVFVSHSMSYVASICDRVILLDRGAITIDGPPQTAIDGYDALFDDGNAGLRYSTGDAEVTSLSVNGQDCINKEIHVRFGRPFEVAARIRLAAKIRRPVLNIYFHDLGFNQVAHGRSHSEHIRNGGGDLEVLCTVPNLVLNPGRWRFSFAAYDGETKKNVVTLLYVSSIVVEGEQRVNAPLQLVGEWRLREAS